MQALEVNFDGLVGPTHNYAGLSFGNIASQNNQAQVANPRKAALQGLTKMKALADMGMTQGVLAPQERPDIHTLRKLGFSGTDANVLAQAAKQAPQILATCCSASSMWTANAATISPSADTADNKIHFTPANLSNKFHRSIEHAVTGNILKATFKDSQHFAHHDALPSVDHFGDEGAANHTRFCHQYGERGVEFFVYGKEAFNTAQVAPQKYPARQTLEASQAIARLHQLSDSHVVYAQQHPDIIDAGVFHNDVIAVGNANLLFCHQQAFLQQSSVKAELLQKMGDNFHIIEAPTDLISVEDAVSSYLFNSQLLSLPNGKTALVIPQECENNPRVWRYLESLVNGDSPIDQTLVFDLKQSMSNGGGPACLRLRVVMNEAEIAAANQATFINDRLYGRLNTWVAAHYRDRISEADLADPQLLLESRAALDELTQILQLGSVYPFQQ
ncbi:MAG: N-succinylarginine dihydrolase [Oceanospirillaceae bacterium]|nr:N-succinylarginine dihydrolase [Oceanospirillaceae bacterium]